MKRLLIPALLLLTLQANAQAQLPAAQPYTASPAVQPVIPGLKPSSPAPSATPSLPTYKSTYTYTSSSESTNPREIALKESFKYALAGLLTTTFQPPIPAPEVTRLTEQSDPARFVQSYRITSESFAPAYTLTTDITWSEKALLNALGLNTPAVVVATQAVAPHGPDVMDTALSLSDTSTAPNMPLTGPTQFILANPQGETIVKFRQTATAAGQTVKMQSFSRAQAVFEADAALAQALTTAGYQVEEDPTAFTPTYRIR